MTERDLVRKLESSFRIRGFLSRREVGVGYGVADLVLIKKSNIDLRRIKKRHNFGQLKPLKNDIYFKILKLIPDLETDRSVSLEYLIKKTNLSKSFLKYSILRYLEKNNYIKETRKGYYFKINGWLPLAKDIIAIEAKLRNWQRGLIQASRYKSFASEVYLAIPENIEHLVNRRSLELYNIGLISYRGKSGIKFIYKPKKKVAINPIKTSLAIENFWNPKILHEVSIVGS